MSGKPVSLAELPDYYRRPGDESLIDTRPQVLRAKEGYMICRMCSNEFHEIRPRCPACGTVPPARKVKPVFTNTPRVIAADACAFCQSRGHTILCDVCGRHVHRACEKMHRKREHDAAPPAALAVS